MKSLRSARWALAAVLAATAAIPALAYAAEPTLEEKARVLFESGKVAKDAKDFATALALFRESHEAYAAPSLEALVYAADCENALGLTLAAYLHYGEFVRNAKSQDERMAEVTNIMSAMKKAGPWIRIAYRDSLAAKTIVEIDGMVLGPISGRVEDIPAQPGEHSVKVLEPAQSERIITVNVQPGKHAVVDFRPKTAPKAGPGFQTVGPEQPKRLPHWVLPAGIIVGGAGGLATLTMGAMFASGAANGRAALGNEENERLATQGTALLITGGVLTTATIVMIIGHQKTQKNMALVPLPLPGGGGVSWVGQF